MKRKNKINIGYHTVDERIKSEVLQSIIFLLWNHSCSYVTAKRATDFKYRNKRIWKMIFSQNNTKVQHRKHWSVVTQILVKCLLLFDSYWSKNILTTELLLKNSLVKWSTAVNCNQINKFQFTISCSNLHNSKVESSNLLEQFTTMNERSADYFEPGTEKTKDIILLTVKWYYHSQIKKNFSTSKYYVTCWVSQYLQ